MAVGAAYALATVPEPRGINPPTEEFEDARRVTVPREKTSATVPLEFPDNPPILQTPDTAAVEYDSEMSAESLLPTRPPAPLEQLSEV